MRGVSRPWKSVSMGQARDLVGALERELGRDGVVERRVLGEQAVPLVTADVLTA